MEIQCLTQRNSDLREENRNLAAKYEVLDQYLRSNKLELKELNLKGQPGEIIKNIGDAVGEPFNLADIDISHRVPTPRQSEKSSNVSFTSQKKRNAVLAKSKKKGISTTNLALPGSNAPKRINERLTRTNKLLGWQYRGRGRQGGGLSGQLEEKSMPERTRTRTP